MLTSSLLRITHGARRARARDVASTLHRDSSSSAQQTAWRPSASPVGVLMMNMGGPSSLDGAVDGVAPFLTRLFSDGEIIRLGPLQRVLGPFIASRRSARIREQYASIGGKSPIGDWTALQGEAMVAKLSAAYPAQAAAGGFRAYSAFRYAPPLTEAALRAMAADGVERAVAFPQYPQFSCTTTGSSMNHLWRELLRLRMDTKFTWSVLDRWSTHPTYLAAVARCVATGLERFPAADRGKVIVIFSAHSVPMLTVNKGDQYVQEVSATVTNVMAALRKEAVCAAPGAAIPPYVLSWQSKVGFLPWMGPSTSTVLKGLAAQGHTRVLLVPVAFTSDHVETLFEIDQEYAAEALKCGIERFERAPSLNGEPLLSDALAQLVGSHLEAGTPTATPQYAINCAQCTNPACRTILNPVAPYVKLRDAAAAAVAADTAAVEPEHKRTPVATWPSQADADAQRALKEPSP